MTVFRWRILQCFRSRTHVRQNKGNAEQPLFNGPHQFGPGTYRAASNRLSMATFAAEVSSVEHGLSLCEAIDIGSLERYGRPLAGDEPVRPVAHGGRSAMSNQIAELQSAVKQQCKMLRHPPSLCSSALSRNKRCGRRRRLPGFRPLFGRRVLSRSRRRASVAEARPDARCASTSLKSRSCVRNACDHASGARKQCSKINTFERAPCTSLAACFQRERGLPGRATGAAKPRADSLHKGRHFQGGGKPAISESKHARRIAMAWSPWQSGISSCRNVKTT